MKNYQWISGVLGLLSAGPLGAFAAFKLSGTLERINVSSAKTGLIAEADMKSKLLEGQRNGFLVSLLILSAYIIMADFKIEDSECSCVLDFIKRHFGEDAAKESSIILNKVFEEKKNNNKETWKNKIKECCNQLNGYLTEEQSNLLIGFLIKIVKADNDVADEEIDALYEIAKWLHVSNEAVVKLDNEKEETLTNIYENIFEFTDLF